jgi:hypothetical protein
MYNKKHYDDMAASIAAVRRRIRVGILPLNMKADMLTGVQMIQDELCTKFSVHSPTFSPDKFRADCEK